MGGVMENSLFLVERYLGADHKTRMQMWMFYRDGRLLFDTYERSLNIYKSAKAKIKMRKKYFDDLCDGEHLHCQPVVMTQDAIIEFAKNFDPQPFHIDETVASESIFRGLVASSLHTLSACTRVVVKAQGNIAILSGVGMHEVKMHNPVRPGDVLTVNARWAELRRSRTKLDRGFASIKCKVTNQKKEIVLEYGYRYLIACQNFVMQRV
jgi:acyl dehydratase